MSRNWLPFDKILENGVIISKNKYVKIIKVIPINYDLKSKLEKIYKDATHPNAEGHEILATELFEFLQKIGI